MRKRSREERITNEGCSAMTYGVDRSNRTRLKIDNWQLGSHWCLGESTFRAVRAEARS